MSPYAALIINGGDERTLVISDLHIGWEISLAEEGIYIPSQTKRLFTRLKEIIFSERPDRLIILGDVKHTIAKIEAEEWRDVPDFFENVLSMIRRVQIVPGNHDGEIEALLPEGVELLPSRGIIIGDIGVFHGHTWPL
ncbi:metallophosphoesterase, partial [Candidatus Bathyarchaeota archaeon]